MLTYSFFEIQADTTDETDRLKDQETETENDLFSAISLLRNNLGPPFSIFWA